MRPDVKHRLKIAYDDLKPINPRLVYGSISGFGQDGPYGQRAGVDQIAQGMGGLMSITGEPGRGPMRVGIAVSDVTAGTLLALAIMMALYQRERTGEGRYVHTSLLECQLFLLDFQAARWLMAGEVAGQMGNDHPTIAPMGAFPTADGHVNIAASSPAQWQVLCEAWAAPTGRKTPTGARAAAGVAGPRGRLNAAIAEETAQQPSAYWVERLEAAGIPCGPILSIDQVFADPQVKHLGMAAPVEHPRLGPTHMVASPLNISGVDKTIRSVAPMPPESIPTRSWPQSATAPRNSPRCDRPGSSDQPPERGKKRWDGRRGCSRRASTSAKGRAGMTGGCGSATSTPRR